MQNDLIDIDEVRALCGGRSRSAIYADATFPQPLRLTEPGRRAGAVRWLRAEVEAWIEERIRERDANAAARRQELLAALEHRRAKRRLTPAAAQST
jgi:predicted DNA-binding transcriptional regulator AlpA